MEVFPFPLQPHSKLNPSFAGCSLPHVLPMYHLPPGNSHCLLQGHQRVPTLEHPQELSQQVLAPPNQSLARLMCFSAFSSTSYYVGMCGDGANDCGVCRSSSLVLVRPPLFQSREGCDKSLPNTTCQFPS